MHLIRVTGVDTDDLGNKQSEDTFEYYVNPAEIKAIVVEDNIGHIAFIHGGDMAVDRRSINLIRRETCTTPKERMATLKTIQSEYYEEYIAEHSADTPVNNLTKDLASHVIAWWDDIPTNSALGLELLGVNNITEEINQLVEILNAMDNGKLPRYIDVTKEDALKLIDTFFRWQQTETADKTCDVYQKFLAKYSRKESNNKDKKGDNSNE